MGLGPLTSWDCGFESRPWQRCLSSRECRVFSGRRHCVRIFSRPEVSYRVCCVCDSEVPIILRPCPTRSCCAMKIKKSYMICNNVSFCFAVKRTLLLLMKVSADCLIHRLIDSSFTHCCVQLMEINRVK